MFTQRVCMYACWCFFITFNNEINQSINQSPLPPLLSANQSQVKSNQSNQGWEEGRSNGVCLFELHFAPHTHAGTYLLGFFFFIYSHQHSRPFYLIMRAVLTHSVCVCVCVRAFCNLQGRREREGEREGPSVQGSRTLHHVTRRCWDPSRDDRVFIIRVSRSILSIPLTHTQNDDQNHSCCLCTACLHRFGCEPG